MSRNGKTRAVAVPMMLWIIQSALADVDFVCKIRATGGDYTNLSTWEAAIESDLTSASSMVFVVSSMGSYTNTDDGSAVTFDGGGVGLLKHINTLSYAYVVGCSGTIHTGSASISGSGHSFVIAAPGDRIGLAVAECYHDWTNGLNHNNSEVAVSGWTASPSHHVVIRAAKGHRHTGVPKVGGVYTGFALEIDHWNSNVLTVNVPYGRVSGIIARNRQSNDNCFHLADDCSIDACIALGSGGNNGFLYSRRCKVWNNLALDAARGFVANAYVASAVLCNNTAVDCGTGFDYHGSQNSGNFVYMRNNLSKCSTVDFATFPGGGTCHREYCASADGTATNVAGTGNLAWRTFSFRNSTNDDFHLSRTDAGAQNLGKNLTKDPDCPFADDIDGERRKGLWDIGCDEIPLSGGTIVIMR